MEDAEYETLSGFSQTLRRDRPDVLLEINNPRNVKKVFNIFPKGYQLYSIDESSQQIKKVSFWFRGYLANRNFLATCKDLKQISNDFFPKIN